MVTPVQASADFKEQIGAGAPATDSIASSESASSASYAGFDSADVAEFAIQTIEFLSQVTGEVTRGLKFAGRIVSQNLPTVSQLTIRPKISGPKSAQREFEDKVNDAEERYLEAHSQRDRFQKLYEKAQKETILSKRELDHVGAELDESHKDILKSFDVFQKTVQSINLAAISTSVDQLGSADMLSRHETIKKLIHSTLSAPTIQAINDLFAAKAQSRNAEHAYPMGLPGLESPSDDLSKNYILNKQKYLKMVQKEAQLRKTLDTVSEYYERCRKERDAIEKAKAVFDTPPLDDFVHVSTSPSSRSPARSPEVSPLEQSVLTSHYAKGGSPLSPLSAPASISRATSSPALSTTLAQVPAPVSTPILTPSQLSINVSSGAGAGVREDEIPSSSEPPSPKTPRAAPKVETPKEKEVVSSLVSPKTASPKVDETKPKEKVTSPLPSPTTAAPASTSKQKPVVHASSSVPSWAQEEVSQRPTGQRAAPTGRAAASSKDAKDKKH